MSYKVRLAVLAAFLAAFMGLTGVSWQDGEVAYLAAYAQDDVEPGGADTTPGVTETGNPSDEPGVIDNPFTENQLDINAQIAMWLAVLGFISTFVVSFINRTITGTDPDAAMKRGVVAFLFCVIVGVADTIVRGTLNLTNVTGAALLVFSTAIAFYNLWFKNSQFAAKIENR